MSHRQLDYEWEVHKEEARLIENGLLEPGQPTEAAHLRDRRRAEAPFSPGERALIRSLLFTPTPEESKGDPTS